MGKGCARLVSSKTNKQNLVVPNPPAKGLKMIEIKSRNLGRKQFRVETNILFSIARVVKLENSIFASIDKKKKTLLLLLHTLLLLLTISLLS